MLSKGLEILQYIPQRQPFLMIDCLYECNEKFVRTGFEPRAENIFSSMGFFTEPGLIENMAQSAAAGTGYYYIHQNKKIPIGFIGAIKNFKLYKLPETNKLLETQIHVVAEVLNATVIQAEIRSDGEKIAACEMKIFLLTN